MFALAICIGIYSYLIFLLGILGLLYKETVLFVSLLCLLILLFFLRSKIEEQLKRVRIRKFIADLRNHKLFVLILSIIFIQGLINLIGVFGPEISFDALWYHLTLPKLYILNHHIFHIPGSNLFYSDTPKLTEMFYTAAMIMANDSIARLIHFSFGILVLVGIYKVARKFVSREFSVLAAVIFYANLVVGWETITAYIDLSRTFFELMAFWGFLSWVNERRTKFLVVSGLMLGLAIATKLVTVESLIIFFCLFAYAAYLHKESIRSFIKNFSFFSIFSFVVPLPWFIFSFLNTGNPFYPYFTSSLADSGNSFVLPNFTNIFTDLYNFFLRQNDPISPVYLISLPLIIIGFRKFKPTIKMMVIYSLAAFVIWYLFLENRGSRFMLPYFPVVSILAVYSIEQLRTKYLKAFLIAVVILVSFISIGYRGIANAKFIPVILGQESRREFLTKYLNFSFGDFYDIDNYFATHLTKNDTVLLYGFGKLYYVGFNFIDSSWVKKGDKFDYIATQNAALPKRFSDWKLIYYNKVTGVKLYTKGGKTWVY